MWPAKRSHGRPSGRFVIGCGPPALVADHASDLMQIPIDPCLAPQHTGLFLMPRPCAIEPVAPPVRLILVVRPASPYRRYVGPGGPTPAHVPYIRASVRFRRPAVSIGGQGQTRPRAGFCGRFPKWLLRLQQQVLVGRRTSGEPLHANPTNHSASRRARGPMARAVAPDLTERPTSTRRRRN